MRATVSVLLTLACAFSFASAEDEQYEMTAAAVLDDTTFFEQVDKRATSFVFFGARNCGNCRASQPEFDRAAVLAKGEAGLEDVEFAYIDANKNQNASKAMGISSVPAYFVFSGEDVSNVKRVPVYKEAEGMVAGLRRVQGLGGGRPVKELADAEKALSTLFWRGTDGGIIDDSVVLLLPESAAPEAVEAARAAFGEAALVLLDRFRSFETSDAATIAVLGSADLDKPAVAVVKEFDEGRALYTGDVTDVGAVAAWVAEAVIPRVGTVTHYNLARMQKHASTLVHVFVQEKAATDPRTVLKLRRELGELLDGMEAAGEVKRGELSLLITNGDQYHSWMSRVGLAPRVVPALGLSVFGRSGDELHSGALALSNAQQFTTPIEDQQAGKKAPRASAPGSELLDKRGGKFHNQGLDGIVRRPDLNEESDAFLDPEEVRAFLAEQVPKIRAAIEADGCADGSCKLADL